MAAGNQGKGGKSGSAKSGSKAKSSGGDKKYYFENRNTPVIAPNAAAAKERKQRPASDKIVKVAPMTASEKKTAKNDNWITTRPDGKSKAKSSVGKGRGQGPPRKK